MHLNAFPIISFVKIGTGHEGDQYQSQSHPEEGDGRLLKRLLWLQEFTHSQLPGQRAGDLLSITVGTQSISPFYWSIDSGA